MSLNPTFSSASDTGAPDAKFSININAFNGNTTNFNRGGAPRPKSFIIQTPVQPDHTPSRFSTSLAPGMVRPM